MELIMKDGCSCIVHCHPGAGGGWVKTALGSFVWFVLMHGEALVSIQVFLSSLFFLVLSPLWKEENSIICTLAGSSWQWVS